MFKGKYLNIVNFHHNYSTFRKLLKLKSKYFKPIKNYKLKKYVKLYYPIVKKFRSKNKLKKYVKTKPLAKYKIPKNKIVKKGNTHKLYKKYKTVRTIDKNIGHSIFHVTQILRQFNSITSNLVKIFTKFTTKKMYNFRDFCYDVLPEDLANPKIKPIVHKSVILLKKSSIMINYTFDLGIKIFIWCGKKIGKGIGHILIKLIDFIENRYEEEILPNIKENTKHFFEVTVNEGFILIETIDESLTKFFSAFTDTILDIIEHCFGEKVKDLTEEISILSKESFEFYKRVKLLKYKNIIKRTVKESGKETFKVMIDNVDSKKK